MNAFMRCILLLLVFICNLQEGKAAPSDEKSVIETLQQDLPSSGTLASFIPIAIETQNRALATYLGRRLAREFPFSSELPELLEIARSGGELRNFAGVSKTAYWLPLPLLRLLCVFSLFSILFSKRLQKVFGGVFFFILILCSTGDFLNLRRQVGNSVFIPLEGDRFALSAPTVDAFAVQKLPSASELTISEYRGDWVQLNLPSGRVGWIRSSEGLIDED
jgi:hypothetical protein